LNSYRECVGLGENLVGKSISRKLAAQDPNNAEWQRDLSISLERVGIILSAESNFAEALDKEVESLAIRKKLASREESNAQWQNDLSWSYISVGDCEKGRGGSIDKLSNCPRPRKRARQARRKRTGTAERSGCDGDVLLRVQVENGVIRETTVVSHSSPFLADSASRWVANQWKFKPSVSGVFTIPVSYRESA
jgi:hypothetical protein